MVKNIRLNVSLNRIHYSKNLDSGNLYKTCGFTSVKKQFKIINWTYSESLLFPNSRLMWILQRNY